jgi:hypothetical protein
MHYVIVLHFTTLMASLIKQTVSHVFQVPAKPVQILLLVKFVSVIKIKTIRVSYLTAIALWNNFLTLLHRLTALVINSNFIKINH